MIYINVFMINVLLFFKVETALIALSDFANCTRNLESKHKNFSKTNK